MRLRGLILVFLVLLGSFTFLQLDFAPNVHATTYSNVFSSSSSDGHITSGNYADYPGINANQTGAAPTNTSATNLVGQIKSGSLYAIQRGFVFFDTSSILSIHTVSTAILSFNFSAIAANNFTLTVKDCGATYPHNPLVAGDYALSNYSSQTTCATFDTTGISALNTYINVSLTEYTGITKGGTTRFALLSDKDLSATAPTAAERVTLYMNESGSPVKLYVTYGFTTSSVQPVIQDFYVNSTWAGNATMWSFNATDTGELLSCTFTENATSPYGATFTNHTIDLSGNLTAWANFTVTLPNVNCYVGFNFWVWNTNSSLAPASLGDGNDSRLIKVYVYNGTAGAWNTPFNSLGDAISAVENANVWGNTENYAKVLLDQVNFTSLQTMIDTYAATPSTGNNVYGSDASGTSWTNPTYSYDNSTSTTASYTWVVSNGWTNYLTINLSTAARGNMLYYMVQRSAAVSIQMQIDIANQTGSWYMVFEPQIPIWNSNVSLSIDASQYTAMRYRFKHPADTTSRTVYVNETEAYNSTTYTCDALNTLKWCAITEKLNMTWANRQNDINWALGNASMVGSLPYTITNGVTSSFSPQSKYALYGFYYANQSWALAYNSSITTKWNITAAYQQFNTSVYYSMTHAAPIVYGMPLYIYANSTGESLSNRFYDEDASTIACYLLFNSLLNVSDGLTQAESMWSYLVSGYPGYFDGHWDATHQYFQYRSDSVYPAYECEASFFLKVIGIMKYYLPNMANYTYVLQDIGNRFLSNKWNSTQWLMSLNQSVYSVIHHYTANDQRRLQNTLGAWQALLGAYLKFNSTYQDNMKDMLYGNNDIEPAWALLLTPDSSGGMSAGGGAGLFNATSNLFSWHSNASATWTADYNATAYGEILMYMMGIVPGTSTVAFPLEELEYEHIRDIDPTLLQLQFNASMKQVVIPVVQSGTIIFQYGVSPQTQAFNSTGIYGVRFSDSWNMIINVTKTGELPTNVIYYYSPPFPPTNNACDSTATFTVNIDSWVNMTVSDVNLVADLATVMIAVTASDSKTFNLTWTQTTDTFSETLDASGICVLNTTSSVRVNVDSDTDLIAFLFKISVAAQSGACSVQATTTDDGALSDVDTYAAEFSIASYSVLTVLAGNSTHSWVNATSGTNDNLLDQGAIYFNVTANFVFKIQAKGDGNLIKGSDYIALGNVTIHEDTLGSSIPLTTSYADVGGLTSQAMGADLTLYVKVWLDVPADQPVGNYVYTLTLQVTS